jgi:hypothetical protein
LPPVPDPAPPPIENPGDAPLPPITDPDVIEPGEPNPAHTPMRVRGAKRSPESFAARLSTFKATFKKHCKGKFPGTLPAAGSEGVQREVASAIFDENLGDGDD